MNTQELVSVIVPTYNRAHILARAINSVLKQSYQNIELIIVDDYSKDNTFEIVNNYLDEDKRIIYIKNKKNIGAACSRNVGIEHSRGVFLSFLDSDCEYLPEKIEKEIGLMHTLEPPPAVIYSNMWREQKDTETVLSLNIKAKLLTPVDIFNCKYHFLDPTAWFCRSDIIKKLEGFDKNMYTYDDIDLLMRIILSGGGIYFFNKPLSIKHSVAGISDISFRTVISKENFLRKHLSVLKKHKKFISKLYNHLGKDLFKLGNFKKSRNYFWQAFLSYPTKIEYLFKCINLSLKIQYRTKMNMNSEEVVHESN